MADERKAVHKRVEYSDKASICADCFHNAVCGGYESKGIVWCEGYANAADVREVVHARWIENGIPDSMLSGCSACGYTCGAYSMRYCPNCGAMMDGEG